MSASNPTLSARPQTTSISLEGAGPVALLGRFLFVLIFLMSSPMHFSRQTIAYAASQGVPLFSGVVALARGLSILLGYRAKIGGWLLVLFLGGVRCCTSSELSPIP